MDGRATDPATLTIRVRRASVADTDAVAAYTRSTWDGWDYIPEIWASWLAARDGVVLAAETERARGRPIAICRATLLSPSEGWMEGLRVDPEVRGRGVAIALQYAQLAWLQAQGARVVRYATGETNEASLRLGGKHGFVEAGRWRALRPEVVEDGRPAALTENAVPGAREREILEALGVDGLVVARKDGARAWDALGDDPTFQRAGSLYEWRAWAWQELDGPRLAHHASRGELLEAAEGDGRALGLLAGERLRGEIRLDLLGGEAGQARRIVDSVTSAAGRRPILRLPDGSPLLAELGPRLASDGWRIGEHTLVLMARSLRDEGGAPLPLPTEGSDRVEFLEEPHPLGLVPAD
jgi:GNAT superfamily N-acetyltransferase